MKTLGNVIWIATIMLIIALKPGMIGGALIGLIGGALAWAVAHADDDEDPNE